MPRVVPSEIVRIIDGYFPAWAPAAARPTVQLGIDQTGQTSAILALINKLPDELLPLSPQVYAEFIAAVEILRSKNELTSARFAGVTFSGEPIWRLRHILHDCPDYAATVHASDLTFIRDRSLRADLRRDITEAYQSLYEGRWKSSTVLAGSVIEALLVWKLSTATATRRQAAISLAIPNPVNRPTGAPARWSFWQLITVAAQTGFITPETSTQLQLAKDYRNLIHPGRAQRKGQRCGKDTVLGSLSGVERTIQDLQR